MNFNKNFARFLTLSDMADYSEEGVLCYLEERDIFCSREQLRSWADEHRFEVNDELAFLPVSMPMDQIEREMENTLGACKNDLKRIFGLGEEYPEAVIERDHATLETIEQAHPDSASDCPPETLAEAPRQPGVQTPFDMPPILRKLDRIEDMLLSMQRDYERVSEYLDGNCSGMTQ